jgi:hypothetical protein
MDDAAGWRDRLGWAFGLVADDAAARQRALERLAEVRRAVGDARARYNELWALTQPLGTDEQWREPAFLAAVRALHEAQRYTLPDGLWGGSRVGVDVTTWPGLPYALLFLEWEARYPQVWTAHAKAWGTKQSLIRELAVGGHREWVKAKLTDLVEIAVNRAYRCKDRDYVRVARAVDGADLRARLASAARSDHPWARVHGGYVLWLLDRPAVPNTRRVWLRWLAEHHVG